MASVYMVMFSITITMGAVMMIVAMMTTMATVIKLTMMFRWR